MFGLLNRKGESRGFVLALGGGGGRGLAHLGVLQVLEEHKLKPDAIVGTSIGALFGAMYALEPDVGVMMQRVESMLSSDLLANLELPSFDEVEIQDQSWLAKLTSAAKQTLLYTRAATESAMVDSQVLIDIAFSFCGQHLFQDADIPVFITAVHFPSGECHLFSAASHVELSSAVAASMAIPGVFSPVKVAGEKYLDGGVASELPSKEARMIASQDQLVLAVNVGARPRDDVEPSNVYGMLDWTTQIKSLYLRKYTREYADILIEPLVGFTQWNDFSNAEKEIERGRQAAYEKMPMLISRLAGS